MRSLSKWRDGLGVGVNGSIAWRLGASSSWLRKQWLNGSSALGGALGVAHRRNRRVSKREINKCQRLSGVSAAARRRRRRSARSA